MSVIYDLTPHQSGIWSRIQNYGDSKEFQIPFIIHLNGEIKKEKIESCINKVIEKNAALKVRIINGTFPKQKIDDDLKIKIDNLIEVSEKKELEFQIKSFVEKPMDLFHELCQFKLFQLYDQKYLVCKFHHIIFDGESGSLFKKELYYQLLDKDLEMENDSYEKFIEKSIIQESPEINNFWRDNLNRDVEDYQQLNDNSLLNRFEFENNLEIDIKKIEDHAFDLKQSLFSTFLGLFRLYISRHLDIKTLSLGVPVSLREKVQSHNTIGYISNVLPHIMEIDNNEGYKNFQDESNQKLYELLDNSNITISELSKLINQKEKPIESYYNCVFDLIKEDDDLNKKIRKWNLESEFPWIVKIIIRENQVFFNSNVKENIFSKWKIQGFHEGFKEFLHGMIKNPDYYFERNICIPSTELSQIMKASNLSLSMKKSASNHINWETSYLNKEIAITDKQRKISYQELDEYSELFSNFILKKNIRKGFKCIVYMKDNFEAAKIFYTLLKNNCCYIPIDSSTPKNRAEFIVEQSQPLIIFSDILDKTETNPLIFNDLDNLMRLETDISLIDSEDNYSIETAYIIFTSGSTGTPKGVEISYQALNCLVNEYPNLFNIHRNDRVAQLSSLSFDASIFEMTLAFSTASTLVIFNHERGYEHFTDFVQGNLITHFLMTPDYYAVLDFSLCDSLKDIIVGGAEFKYNSTVLDEVKVFNAYGPTESTVMCLIKEMTKEVTSSNIGKPILNSGVIILTQDEEVASRNVIGEICIAGKSLFKDYLNKNESYNLQKITVNNQNYIVYKTGDMGFYDKDYDIHFYNRNSNFTKIRGYRINPNEVTMELLKIPNVDNAITIVNDNLLISFIVGNNNEKDIKKELRKRINNFMMPTMIYKLNSFPMTINGKINKDKLIEHDNLTRRRKFEVKYNGEDSTLINIVKSSFKSSDISKYDNFYDIGGDSITSISLANEFQNLGYNISSVDIMKSFNFKELFENINRKNLEHNQQSVSGEAHLLPMQKWFFSQDFQDIHHWNQSYDFEVYEKLSKSDFKEVYSKLCEKHDSLRTNFEKKDNNIKWIINEYNSDKSGNEVMFNYDLNDSAFVNIQMQSMIDIFNGPVSLINIIKVSEDHFKVHWVIHHLVCDNISWMILKRDFMRAVDCIVNNYEIVLSPKSSNVIEWGKFIHELPDYGEDEVYTNFNSNLQERRAYKVKGISLKMDIKNKIEEYCNTNKISEENLLLVLFAKAISVNINKNKIYIKKELNGRNNIPEIISLDQTVGWFTKFCPLEIDCSISDENFVSANIFKVEESSSHYDRKFSSSVDDKGDISFNYLGDITAELDIDEISIRNNISELDFPDKVAINVLKKENEFYIYIIFQEDMKFLVDQVEPSLKDLSNRLLQKSPNNVFGISEKSMKALNDLF